jgi:hypothetical protein
VLAFNPVSVIMTSSKPTIASGPRPEYVVNILVRA